MVKQILEKASLVQEQSGKSVASQVVEMIALRRGKSKVNPEEYYNYRLYDDNFSLQDKQQFGGWQFKEKTMSFKDGRWDWPMRDKILSQIYLEGVGLLCPKILAFCGNENRHLGLIPAYKPDQTLVEFLRDEIEYPFFCKPVAASLGRDGTAVLGFDESNNSLILANETRLSVNDFLQRLKEEDRGTVFQHSVAPHPETVEIFGNRLSSLRLVSLMHKEKTRVFKAVLKIPSGKNMTDNFDHGQSGNIIAKINTETGEIEKVISGVGIHQCEVDKHPDTGKSLLGFVIPEWEKTRDICLLATKSYPGLFMQHWDIAIGENGPSILEMNFPGDIDLLQHAYGEGIINDELNALMKERSLSKEY